MAGYPPKKNAAYIFYSSLVDSGNRPDFKSSPTIASGDFKVSTDGGALGNLATIPAVTPGSSVMVKFSLSAGEMNGNDITVVCIDVAGAEWDDLLINIQTATRQIDDLAYPATSGRSFVVDTSGVVDANVLNWLGSAVSSLDASTVSSAVSSSTITQYRGDDWSIALTGLGSISGSTEVWFTIKTRQSDTDAQAAVILSDGTGLEIINGTAGTVGNGTLTVNDASAGDITMTLKAVETAKLAIGTYIFDVQWKNSSSAIKTIADGTFTVSADATLAVS